MSPPILPAYSLRVQLFSSTACDSEDKPVRNFRVVTSPEITVREFCQEASRIHEINYGQPLVIKRVQDDQAFDVTQSEILGNLFGTSSIVRVVQVSKHSGIRDSIPPTSALRFNPLPKRKRERYNDDFVPNLESSWGSSKRQKFYVTDPDCPLPSRESEAVSPPIPSQLSQSQVASALGRIGNIEKYYPKKSKCQISETPEPVSTGWQSLRAPGTRSVGTQKYSKSDYHEQRNSYKHKYKDYRHVEPGTREYEITSQHLSKAYLRESSASSAKSSIYLGQSPAKNISTQSPKLGKNPIPMGVQNDLELNSIHNQVAKKKILKFDAENSKNHGINKLKPGNNSSKKAQTKSISSQGLVDAKQITEISRGAKVHDTSQNTHSLEEVHSENITSKNLNYKSHIEKVEQQNNYGENSIKGTENIKEVKDIQNKQKKKKRKKKKEITQKSEPQPNSLAGGDQNQEGKKPSQELEANYKNIDSSVTNREQILLKEPKSAENCLQSKTASSGRKNDPKPTASTENLKDDLNTNSPSLKSISKKNTSSSVIPPPRERKRNSAIESSQAQNSSHPETSNQEKNPTNDYSNHIISQSNTTVLNNEEKKEDVATRILNQILPNTPASLQTKSSTPNSSHIKDTKSNIPLQKKSFTPILPPQKAIDISNILIASDESKTRTTRSKTASAAKIIPTKITPVILNKKSQHTKPNNKSKLPNGISNKEPISIESFSKSQELNCRNHIETNESFNNKDIDDEDLANSVIEISSNKENIQEASINAQSKNLKELEKTSNANKTEDDNINREEVQSQNSSDRDSRSPIEFHQNFQPKIFHRTSSLSSNSHSDIEDSKINDDTPSSVLDNSVDSSDVDVEHKLEIHENASDNSYFQFKPITNITTQLNLDYQESRPSSPHSILKVQVPNSSPALKRNVSSKNLTNTNMSDLSHSEAQDNPSTSFISGPVVVPSTLEVKKPQFKFGASLSEIHRSGGLLSMTQTSQRSNEQNKVAMSLATEIESGSESEESDTSSSS